MILEAERRPELADTVTDDAHAADQNCASTVSVADTLSPTATLG
jgi:hypothetical protein